MTRNRHIQLLTIEYAAKARGVGKTHSYEQARGLLLGTTHSDGTTARAYTYNHLGQLTQVVDDAGTRTIGYNAYNEQESDSLLAGGKTHLVTELRDDYGRSSGYTYANNGSVQQTVSTGYGTDGRISSAGFVHGGAQKLFTYSYLPGTNLLQTLVKPNNMTLTQSYEEKRDLLIGQLYKRSNTSVASRSYTYDTLGRPVTRSTSKDGSTVNDTFGYNSRSELYTATVNNEAYTYDYDNIGNRETAREVAESATTYESNQLNQYTTIGDFEPTYDDAGNQTMVKTKTGIWTVVYNAENRPTTFTNVDSGTIIECSYDFMGRRATKKVTVNGSVTLHQRFLYRGYLQIACCDLTRSNHPCLWLIAWDPSQPIVTRPLAIQKDGTWYTYGWDLTKNICEVYGQHGYIRTNYSYSPYGEVFISGDVTQPIQWSSEYEDPEISIVYYNYRYYNPIEGRWTGRDPYVGYADGACYMGLSQRPSMTMDYLGLYVVLCFAYEEWVIIGRNHKSKNNEIEINDVFSGNGDDTNNPNSQHKPNDGPIPIGEYWIGHKVDKSNPAHPEGNYEWYPLYGDDGQGGKSRTHIPVKDPNSGRTVIRNLFYIHTGSGSDGCITVKSTVKDTEKNYPQSPQYEELIKFIDKNLRQPFRNPRKEQDEYVGIMYVRKCRKDCEEVIESYIKSLSSN